MTPSNTKNKKQIKIMENIFNSVRVEMPPYSTFDLSHSHRLSLKMGNIVPFMFEETVPGDRWKIKTDILTRFAPLITPVMEQFDIKVEYFNVPYRLLWQSFEEWIVGELTVNPPSMTNIGDGGVPILVGSLHDYLGIVPQISYDVQFGNNFNAFGHLAYQKIWFDWYRDQNHQFPNDRWEKDWIIKEGQELINLANDPVRRTKYEPLRLRAREHDYLTSALPWAQKGDAVLIPFGEFENVPVYSAAGQNQPPQIRRTDGVPTGTAAGLARSNGPSSHMLQSGGGDPSIYFSDLTAQTSELAVPSPTINELRRAEAIQKWLERNARAGTRYVEHVLANFGKKTKDYRLARAEMIGAQSMPVIVSEVLQTSGTTEDGGVLGDMGGRAISASDGQYYTYTASEHGAIIGNITVMNKSAYYQGVNKKFWRKSPFDYVQPLLAQIGEQPVETREVYITGAEDQRTTWGYQSRYADWKYGHNQISGDFRTSLDDWHYAFKMDEVPGLNMGFISWSGDNRIFAVQEEIDNVYCMLYINLQVERALPFYGTPTN